MKKLRETLGTLAQSAHYSFSFCWRNSKSETAWRIATSILITLFGYFLIQVTGLVINKTQSSIMELKQITDPSMDLKIFIIKKNLLHPAIILLVTLILVTIISRLNWFYRNRWNLQLKFANQRELNDHRSTLDVARFKSKEYDDLQKRIQELPTSWQTRIYFSDDMFGLFTNLLSFILFGISLVWYKPIYALILIITSTPMIMIQFNLVNKWWNLFQELVPYHKKRGVLERPYSRTNAFIQAIMFNQTPSLREEIDNNVNIILNEHNKVRKIVVKKEIISHISSAMGLCLVVMHAIWLTVVNIGEVGTLTIIIAAARTFQGNLEMTISIIADQWNSAKGVILIEKEFLGLKPFIKTEYPVIPDFKIIPKIEFKDVSFAYPDTENLVLKKINFSIEPGKKVAIVGKSGHGKSTIQALLMRHYDPTSGSVYAGNVNLRNIEPHVWNNVASALTQEYTILERKIGEEITSSCLGQPINLEKLNSSSRFADFQEVVDSDPFGYDSQIGVDFGGRDFSGGEKQRLALARVRYRGTPILILDEPDSKLDPESANKIIDNIMNLKDITVIMITHHISRAEKCDKIIVMQNGEVAEDGTHEELIKKNGVYTFMYEKDKERLMGTIS